MSNGKNTITDIARKAGVSVSTVSRALNNAGRVDAETKKRIEIIAANMGYRPSMAAQSMRTRKSRNIVLVVPDITNLFYSTLAKSLQGLVQKKNYILTLFNTNEMLSEELRAIETAKAISAGGIVLASVTSHQCVIDALKKLNIPTVLLNSYTTDEFDTVYGQLNLGTYLSTKHLIENGHRRIAYVGAPADTVIGKSRRQGFANALAEAGIVPDEQLCFELKFTEEAGYEAGKCLATHPHRPTAVCCANDIIALGVMAALYESGIKVPEQISVIGMDNILYSRISTPPLTTISNDCGEFARRGFELLFDRIEGRYKGASRKVVLGRELIRRQSVARCCCPQADAAGK